VLAVTNEALARRQMRKANWLLLVAMLIFVAGFFSGIVLPQEMITQYGSLGALVLGFFLWQVSQYYTRRYGPRYRQDAALERNLKGLDNRYALISFAAPRLPDYLLLGPHGVQALIPRDVSGTVRCRGDKWSRAQTPGPIAFFLGNPLRNPSGEAAQSVAAVERYVERELAPAEDESLPIGATIVFTNPNVQLEIEGSRFPVTRARDLRQELRHEQGIASPTLLARLRQALMPTAEDTAPATPAQRAPVKRLPARRAASKPHRGRRRK
jgi:hypothetical protein